jgi:hypothetical protein
VVRSQADRPHFAHQTANPNTAQGPLYLWFDYEAQLAFVTVGRKRPGRHQYLDNGSALRFDEATKKFVGFAWLVMPTRPIALPIYARLTLITDGVPAWTPEPTNITNIPL